MGLEEDKLEFEKHKNCRDEQFWFTAAVFSFNGFLLVRAEVPPFYAVVGAALVSLLGMYLVLTRWLACADRRPAGEPEAKKHNAVQRLRYSVREMGASLLAFPYVIVELSGSCFYLLIMLVSFIGVVLKHWHGF